jgi:enoyl-CoA hydratase
MYQTLLTHLNDGIFIITINRPEKLNALNAAVIGELAQAIDDVYYNAAIKSAIITGAGEKAFVAGADISEFLLLNGAQGTQLAKRGHDLVFNRIENCPKPIIAAVNGFALGGGCELAMACHFRLASENARFGQPEVNLGLVPGYGGTQRLIQLIGKGRALEYTLTGNMIGTAEALAWGLVNYVLPKQDLLPKAIALLQLIQTKAPLAIAKVISLINTAAYNAAGGLQKEIETFGELFDTSDAKEGAAAFLEKRKPAFSGK